MKWFLVSAEDDKTSACSEAFSMHIEYSAALLVFPPCH